MRCDLDVSGIFSSNGSVFPALSFPRPGPSGWFPGVVGRMVRSDSLPHVTPRLVPRSALPPSRPLFALPPSDRVRREPGFWSTGSQTGNLGGNDRASQVPGRPLCVHAVALRPRWDLGAWPVQHSGVAFRCFDDVGSHYATYFRGSITQPTLSLSTLRSHGYPLMYSHARLASERWPAYSGGLGYPQGRSEWFLSPQHSISSFPRLGLAHRNCMSFLCFAAPTRMPQARSVKSYGRCHNLDNSFPARYTSPRSPPVSCGPFLVKSVDNRTS